MATKKPENFWEVLMNAGAAGLQGAGTALEKQEQKKRGDLMNLFAMAGQVSEQEQAQQMHGLAMTKAMLDNKMALQKLHDATDPVAYAEKKAQADAAYASALTPEMLELAKQYAPQGVSAVPNIPGVEYMTPKEIGTFGGVPNINVPAIQSQLGKLQGLGLPGQYYPTISAEGKVGFGYDQPTERKNTQFTDNFKRLNTRLTVLQRNRGELMAKGKDVVGRISLTPEQTKELEGISDEEDRIGELLQMANDYSNGFLTPEQAYQMLDSNPDLTSEEKSTFRKEMKSIFGY